MVVMRAPKLIEIHNLKDTKWNDKRNSDDNSGVKLPDATKDFISKSVWNKVKVK